jgi:hypothetical protein
VTTDIDISPGTRAPEPLAAPAPAGSAPPGQDLLPFAWEADSYGQDLGERETIFRFPAADDPSPGTARVLIMAIWASLLGLAGVGVGLRAFVAVFGGTAPGWYVPLLALTGLSGVALVVGAFLSVHRRFVPWFLLLMAAGPLVGDIMLATSY